MEFEATYQNLPKNGSKDVEAETIELMNDWQSAYDKANTHWFDGGLTRKEIDSALTGSNLAESERQSLISMKDNFDDLSLLNGSALLPAISSTDPGLTKKIFSNTARDIQYYEPARQFLVDNKEDIDTNDNGTIESGEILDAKGSSEFSDSGELLEYLSDRYFYNLKHTDNQRTSFALIGNVSSDGPDADLNPGGLPNVIDRTQELAYTYQTIDSYRTPLNVAALAGTAVAGSVFKFGALGTVGAFLGLVAVGGVAIAQYSKWNGAKQQDSQENRIHNLTTNISNFNY